MSIFLNPDAIDLYRGVTESDSFLTRARRAPNTLVSKVFFGAALFCQTYRVSQILFGRAIPLQFALLSLIPVALQGSTSPTCAKISKYWSPACVVITLIATFVLGVLGKTLYVGACVVWGAFLLLTISKIIPEKHANRVRTCTVIFSVIMLLVLSDFLMRAYIIAMYTPSVMEFLFSEKRNPALLTA